MSVINFERKLPRSVSPTIASADSYQFVYLMKNSSSLTIIRLLALSLGFASQAQAQMKVGTIDMQKVFTAYYKTHDAEDKLKEAQRAYKDELDQRMDAYKKNLDVINKLNEEMNKPELGGTSKVKRPRNAILKSLRRRVWKRKFKAFADARKANSGSAETDAGRHRGRDHESGQ